MSDDLSPDQLLAVANDASRQVRNLFITFCALLVYLALIVGATTDLDLLLNARTQLPLISIELPIEGIFSVAPFLLLVLHADLLMQVLLLRKKLWHLKAALDVISPERFRERRLDAVDQFIYTQSVTGRHLQAPMRLILVVICQVVLFGLPLLLLLAFQLRYLPAHDVSITAWHRVLVVADAAILAYVGLHLGRYYSAKFDLVTSTPILVMAASAPLVSLFIFVVPGERLDLPVMRPLTHIVFGPDVADRPVHWETGQDVPTSATQLSQLSARLFHRNLDLAGSTLVSRAPSDAMLAAYVTAGRPTTAAWREQTAGINLSGRDLRFANLRGARMPRANLKGANLSGANLSSTDLNDGALDGVIAVGAQFGGAKMRRATLRGAILVGADFYQTDLTAAELLEANATTSLFLEADLTAAVLASAELDGARIVNSELRGALATRALMRATTFEGSSLRAATLRGSQLGGARFGSAGQSVNKAHLVDLTDVGFTLAPKATWAKSREHIERNLGHALLAPGSKRLSNLQAAIGFAEKRTKTELGTLEHQDDMVIGGKTVENARGAGLDYLVTTAAKIDPEDGVRERILQHLVEQSCVSRDIQHGLRIRAALDSKVNEAAYREAVKRRCEG